MNNRKRRESGIGVIGMIVLIPVLIIAAAVAWYGYCEARKAYWDHQVKLMCEKDGGVKVYEKLAVTKMQLTGLLNEYGQLSMPDKDYMKPTDKFFTETKSVSINSAKPEVWRTQYDLHRASDNKLLAIATTFGRRGGDFPTWAHDSSFTCADVKGRDFLSFEKYIFIVQGE